MTASGPGPRRIPIFRRLPPSSWAIIALAVIGIVVYLVVDHWPHVLAALPYVGILAFAAMHLFGHGGHGGHGGGGSGHGGHGGSGSGHGGHGGSGSGHGGHGGDGSGHGNHSPSTSDGRGSGDPPEDPASGTPR